MRPRARAISLPPEQELLLALVRGESGRDAWCTNDCGELWLQALGLAERHGVAPLLHAQAQAGALPWLPELARRELRAARIAELSLEEKRARALEAVLRILSGSGAERCIPVLLLKGAASARTLYAQPELRPRSDLDLLIAPDDRAEALARLEAQGYAQHAMTRGTREDQPGWHERTLVHPASPGQQLDLHFALAQAQRHRLDARALLAASVREPALGAAARLLPPAEATLVCAHSLAVHELAAPLITLCDLARLLVRCDPERLARLAREVRLGRALFVSLALLERLSSRPARAEAGVDGADAKQGAQEDRASHPAAAAVSLCGATVERAQLEALAQRLALSAPIERLLHGAAAGFDLSRRRLPRAHQLWRKALFIDRPGDAARFAARHLLESVRLARRSRPR